MDKLQRLLINKRKELNLSLRDAGKLIGISHSYLSNLEKGIDPRTNTSINPTPDTLKLISDAYNLSYTKLMELTGYIDEGYSNRKLEEDTDQFNSSKDIDIALEIDKIKTLINDSSSICFYGDPLMEESRALLLEGMEYLKKQCKVLKKKVSN